MRKINRLILHCSATQEGKDFHASDIDKWHKTNGWNGIGYHYVVDLVGNIEKGRDEALAGAHCSGHNSDSIGICYIGGVDESNKAKDTRTREQRFSLFKLVHELMEKHDIPLEKVFGHNEFTKAKACPSFDMGTFRRELAYFIGTRKKK